MTEDNASAENKDGGDAAAKRPEGVERRNNESGRRANVVDRRVGMDRRRGPGRRRSETRRAAEEGEMTDDQFEFLMAINRYKNTNNRPFPSWTEVLDVIQAIGYRKVAEPTDIK